MNRKIQKALKSSLALFLAVATVISTSVVAFAVPEPEKKLNVVSIGDSMTTGFGYDDYYLGDCTRSSKPEYKHESGHKNVRGFMVEAAEAYPSKLVKMLEDAGYDVNLNQLASNALRVNDVYYILDPDDYQARKDHFSRRLLDEDYGGEEWFAYWGNRASKEYKDGNPATPVSLSYDPSAQNGIDVLNEVYCDAIADADIVTLNIGYNNFGVYLTGKITDDLGLSSYDDYTDADSLQVLVNRLGADIDVEKVRAQIYDLLLKYAGFDATQFAEIDLGSMKLDIESYVDVILQAYIGYAYYFTRTIDKITSLNPDATVIVVGLQNTQRGLKIILNGNEIDLGDFYGKLLEMANVYAALISPNSDKYYFADLDGVIVDRLFDELAGDFMSYSDDVKHRLFEGIASFGLDDMINSMIMSSPDFMNGIYQNIISNSGGMIPNVEAAEQYFNSVDGNTRNSYINAALQVARQSFGLTGSVDAAWLQRQYDAFVTDPFHATLIQGVVFKIVDILAQAARVECIDFDAGINVLANAGGDMVSAIASSIATYISEGTIDDSIKGLLCIYVRLMLSNGIWVHPSESGHDTVANEIFNLLLPKLNGEEIPTSRQYMAQKVTGIISGLVDEYGDDVLENIELLINNIDSSYGISKNIAQYADDLANSLVSESELLIKQIIADSYEALEEIAVQLGGKSLLTLESAINDLNDSANDFSTAVKNIVNGGYTDETEVRSAVAEVMNALSGLNDAIQTLRNDVDNAAEDSNEVVKDALKALDAAAGEIADTLNSYIDRAFYAADVLLDNMAQDSGIEDIVLAANMLEEILADVRDDITKAENVFVSLLDEVCVPEVKKAVIAFNSSVYKLQSVIDSAYDCALDDAAKAVMNAYNNAGSIADKINAVKKAVEEFKEKVEAVNKMISDAVEDVRNKYNKLVDLVSDLEKDTAEKIRTLKNLVDEIVESAVPVYNTVTEGINVLLGKLNSITKNGLDSYVSDAAAYVAEMIKCFDDTYGITDSIKKGIKNLSAELLSIAQSEIDATLTETNEKLSTIKSQLDEKFISQLESVATELSESANRLAELVKIIATDDYNDGNDIRAAVNEVLKALMAVNDTVINIQKAIADAKSDADGVLLDALNSLDSAAGEVAGVINKYTDKAIKKAEKIISEIESDADCSVITAAAEQLVEMLYNGKLIITDAENDLLSILDGVALPAAADALLKFNNAIEELDALVSASYNELVNCVLNSIVDAYNSADTVAGKINAVKSAAKTAMKKINDTVAAINDAIENVKDQYNTLVDTLTDTESSLCEKIAKIKDQVEMIAAAVSPLYNAIAEKVAKASEMIFDAVSDNIDKFMGDAIDYALEALIGVDSTYGISKRVIESIKSLKDSLATIKEAGVDETVNNACEALREIAENLKNGSLARLCEVCSELAYYAKNFAELSKQIAVEPHNDPDEIRNAVLQLAAALNSINSAVTDIQSLIADAKNSSDGVILDALSTIDGAADDMIKVITVYSDGLINSAKALLDMLEDNTNIPMIKEAAENIGNMLENAYEAVQNAGNSFNEVLDNAVVPEFVKALDSFNALVEKLDETVMNAYCDALNNIGNAVAEMYAGADTAAEKLNAVKSAVIALNNTVKESAELVYGAVKAAQQGYDELMNFIAQVSPETAAKIEEIEEELTMTALVVSMIYSFSTTGTYIPGQDSYYLAIGDSITTGLGVEGSDGDDWNAGYGSALAAAYPQILAEMFGINDSTHHNVIGMGGIRVDDVLYILDPDSVPDDYFTNRTIGELRSNGKCYWGETAGGDDTVNAVRSYIVSEIEKADLITLSLGGNNFGTFVTACMNNYNETGTFGYDIDFTRFCDKKTADIIEKTLDDAFAGAIALMIKNGASEENINGVKTIAAYAKVYLYAYLAYSAGYSKVVAAINAYNPDAMVVITGLYNTLDSTYYSKDGIYIPVGEIMDYLVGIINLQYLGTAMYSTYNGYNTIYVDITNTEMFADKDENRASLNFADGEYLDYMTEDRGKISHPDEKGHVIIAEDIYNAIAPLFIPGDADGNGVVNSEDAVYLLNNTLDPENFILSCDGDIDGNGVVNSEDAIYLLNYTLDPENFPIGG